MEFESILSEDTNTSSFELIKQQDEVDYFAHSIYNAMKATSTEEKLKFMDFASRVLDSILDNIKSPLYSEAVKIIDYPLLDIFELVEAMGWQPLSKLLRESIEAIEGTGTLSLTDVNLLADLLGWSKSPLGVDQRVLGYAVILSITGSFNKALNKLAEAIWSDLQ